MLESVSVLLNVNDVNILLRAITLLVEDEELSEFHEDAMALEETLSQIWMVWHG